MAVEYSFRLDKHLAAVTMALWLGQEQHHALLSVMARRCLLLVPVLYRDTRRLLDLLQGHERESPNNKDSSGRGNPAQVSRWHLQNRRRPQVERIVHEAIQSLAKMMGILAKHEQQMQQQEQEQEQQQKKRKKKKPPKINVTVSESDTDALEKMEPRLREQHQAIVAETGHLMTYFTQGAEQAPGVKVEAVELPAAMPVDPPGSRAANPMQTVTPSSTPQMQVPPPPSWPHRPTTASSASIDNVNLLRSFFVGTPSSSSGRSTASTSAAATVVHPSVPVISNVPVPSMAPTASTSLRPPAPRPTGLAALFSGHSSAGLQSAPSQTSLQSLYGTSLSESFHNSAVELPDTSISRGGEIGQIDVRNKSSATWSSERGAAVFKLPSSDIGTRFAELEAPVPPKTYLPD